ncbi:membrane-spanning protein, partial [Bacillus subtilis]
YIAIGIPFFIYTILDIILDTFNFQSYSPLKFLFLDVPFTYGIYVIATVTIIILFVVFCVGGKKSENI